MLKKILPLICFLSFGAHAFSQNVSTYVTNSGVDDAILITSKGKFYGTGWRRSTLFDITTLPPKVVFDSLNNGTDLCEDHDGNILFCDFNGGKVYKLNSTTNKVSLMASNIEKPGAIAMMQDSDTFLVGSTSSKVYKVAPDGNVKVYMSGGLLSSPGAIAYDDYGNLFIGNYYNGKIVKIDTNGNMTDFCTLPTSSLGRFARMGHHLFVTGVFNHRIYRVNLLSGDWTLFAGTDKGSRDGKRNVATFDGPNGIAVSATGDTLFVSDFGTLSIRIITDYNLAVDDVSNIRFLNLYPNPNQGRFTVELDVNNEVTFELNDILGRHYQVELISKNFVSGKGVFDLRTSSPQGMYMLKAKSAKGQMVQPIWVK